VLDSGWHCLCLPKEEVGGISVDTCCLMSIRCYGVSPGPIDKGLLGPPPKGGNRLRVRNELPSIRYRVRVHNERRIVRDRDRRIGRLTVRQSVMGCVGVGLGMKGG
jgi:hypothetical protein